jgi:hypothetical protein
MGLATMVAVLAAVSPKAAMARMLVTLLTRA